MFRFIPVILSLLFCSYTYAAPDSAPEKLRIGVSIPLSGDLAYFGKALQQGIRLGLSDGAGKNIAVTYDDDMSGDRKATVTAIKSYLARDIKVAVVTAMPNVVIADPIARRSDLLVISAWDSNNQIKSLSNNTFGFGWSNENTGEVLAAYAVDTLKRRKVAIVAAHDEWSELISEAFARQFQASGGEVVLKELVGLDDTDFRSLVLRIKSRGADSVYFPLYRASLLSFAKQITQSGFEGALLSAEGITESEVEQLGDRAEGMHITQAVLHNNAFEQQYLNFYKLDRLDLNLAHVALGYDLIHFLSECVDKLRTEGDSLNVQNIREIFKNIHYKGILGSSKFSSARSTERKQSILAVKDGKLTIVQ